MTAVSAVERYGARAAVWVRAEREHAPAAAVSFAAVFLLAVDDGGYFPPAWGWSAVVLSWVAAVVMVLRRRSAITRFEAALLATLAGVTVWTALSGIWAAALQGPVLEVERTLVYVALVGALLATARRGGSATIVAAAAAAGTAVCGFALVTRLRPDVFGIYDDPTAHGRLYQPLGYWNALGIFTSMTALLCLGAAVRARSRPVRIAAAAALPPLGATLYFTFSRGSMMAFVLGLAFALVLDRKRLRSLALSLALAPWAGIAIAVSHSKGALGRGGAGVAAASAQGRPLLLVIVTCAAGAGLTVVAAEMVERRVRFGPWVRRAYLAGLALAAAAIAVAAVATYGSPVRMVRRAADALSAKAPELGGPQSQRLQSLSLNGRPILWRAALGDFSAHPILGSGAGTFEQVWNRDRPRLYAARDAHSLYLERLAEQGPLGLVLVVLVFVLPLAAAVRYRDDPVVLTSASALMAFTLHSGFDWDWEMPAVTGLAIVCATAIVLAGRGRAANVSVRAARPVLIGLAVVVGMVAFVGGIGNEAEALSRAALARGDWRTAASDADRATSWEPWSDLGWLDLAQADIGLGRKAAATAALRTATEKDPVDWLAWRRLADQLTGQARLDALRMSARLNPKSTRRSLGHADRVRLGLTGHHPGGQ